MNTRTTTTMEDALLSFFNRDLRAPDLSVTALPDALDRARELLPSALPEHAIGEEACVQLLSETIAPALAGGQSGPHYYGFVTGGRTPISLLADCMVSSYDQNVQVHLPEVTISTEIEASAAAMVLDLLDIPRSTYPARTITTGATASNILGLSLAREALVSRLSPGHSTAEDGPWSGKIVGYAADGHASIRKAAALLGIGRKNIRNGRKQGGEPAQFDLLELERFLKQCKEERDGAVVLPSYGEVNTGAFTHQMKEIRRLCDEYGAWVHLDAAFGAFAALHPDFQQEVNEGLQLADSLTIDAHKWLNVPYDCALFYTRDPALFHAVLGPGTAAPAYLSTGASSTLPSPLNTRIENSSRFRGLPLYASLLTYGKAGYTEIVCRNIAFARRIEGWLRDPAGGQRWYDVLTPISSSSTSTTGEGGYKILNIVLFAPSDQCGKAEFLGKEGAQRWVMAINATGRMYVTGTEWEGRAAARLAVSNHLTAQPSYEDSDFERVIEVLGQVMQEEVQYSIA